MTKQVGITHKNHFAPRMYLKRFEGRSGKLWAYRLFVPHYRANPWRQASTDGVGYLHDLYTRSFLGVETDEIEKWLERSFERPAEQSIERATRGEQLDESDWHNLVRFLAAQQVRTPAFLKKHLILWNGNLPADPYHAVAREQWFDPMNYLLTNTLQILHQHKWSIRLAPGELLWFTSDDPVIALNYNADDNYDFNGGWGNSGTEILLPLSGRHLLYTKVGDSSSFHGSVFSSAQAKIIRRMIAEHACEYIYASDKGAEISTLRRSTVKEGLNNHI